MMKYTTIIYLLLSHVWLYAQNMQRAHHVIEDLCAQNMHGRSPCYKGDEKAAHYIANLFVEAKLKPLSNTFFQPFTYSTQTFPKQMALSINGKKLKPGVDFIIDPVSATGKGKVQLVYLDSTFFVQHAVYNKNVSFQRKAVVYDQKFYKQLTELPLETIQQLYQAACIIEINHPKLTMDVGSKPLSIPIFKLGKTDPSSMRSGTCSFHLYSKYEENYTSKNVMGYVEGHTKPDSFLVFTAHYDHLGHLGKKTYFPGANDNASGIAMLHELAIYFSDSTHRLPYSILFIAFAGEEAGLIGSKYFTQHPLIDLRSIKFLVNMDIMGTGDESITIVNATKHPTQFNTIDSLNKRRAYLPAVVKRGPAANSDHHYFSQKGVPAFFMYTNGKQKAYHDVFDVPSNLSLEQFAALFHLLVDFSQTF
jgi:aminopeptidase YwaD